MLPETVKIGIISKDSLIIVSSLNYCWNEELQINADLAAVFDLCRNFAINNCGHDLQSGQLDIGNTINKYIFIYDNYNNINGLCRIRTTGDVSEIYDYCINKDKQRQGIGSILLNFIVNNIFRIIKTNGTNHKIWLALLFDNPNFDNVSNFYVKNNFINPNITTKSPTQEYPFPILEMECVIENNIVQKNIDTFKTKNKIAKLKNLYNIFIKPLTLNLFIPKNVCDQLYSYLNLTEECRILGQCETSGFLDVDVIINDSVQLKVIDGTVKTWNTLDCISHFADEMFRQLSKSESYITFHTHPKQCYISRQMNIGWPSVQDYILCLQNPGSIVLISALEGLYALYATKDFSDHFFQEFTEDSHTILEFIRAELYNLMPMGSQDSIDYSVEYLEQNKNVSGISSVINFLISKINSIDIQTVIDIYNIKNSTNTLICNNIRNYKLLNIFFTSNHEIEINDGFKFTYFGNDVEKIKIIKTFQ